MGFFSSQSELRKAPLQDVMELAFHLRREFPEWRNDLSAALHVHPNIRHATVAHMVNGVLQSLLLLHITEKLLPRTSWSRRADGEQQDHALEKISEILNHIPQKEWEVLAAVHGAQADDLRRGVAAKLYRIMYAHD
jgi:hypothetical protein